MPSKEEYLNLVSEQIRFKAARKVLRSELESHICEKTKELEKKGAQNAEEQAVAAMGDAAQIGKALNAVHRPRIEWRVLLCLLLLSAAGVLLSFMVTGYGVRIFPEDVFYKMIRPMLIGIALMAGLSFLNYTYLKKLRYVFYGAALVYTGAYIITFVRHEMSLWMAQTPVIVISTLFLIIGIAGLIEYSKDKKLIIKLVTAILCVVPIVIMSIITLNHGFLLAVLSIGTFAAAMLHKHKLTKVWWQFLIIAAIIIGSYIACYMLVGKTWIGSPYAFYDRLFAHSSSFDVDVSKVFEGARFVGPSSFYLEGPAWQLWASRTGYIITAIIGAYGWLAGILVVLASLALCLFMLSRSLRITHSYGRLLSIGVSAYFLTRVVLCILTNFGALHGNVNLPFISFGRFDYLADALLVGVFLSVWRRSTFMKEDTVSVKTKKHQLTQEADVANRT